MSHDRPKPFPMELVTVGNQIVHPTHKLNLFEGIIYCRTCGYKAQTKGGGFLKKLVDPCPKAPASQYGIESLKAFSEG